jgi:hypothetical protein
MRAIRAAGITAAGKRKRDKTTAELTAVVFELSECIYRHIPQKL